MKYFPVGENQTRSRQISILKQYNSLADKIWYSWTYWVLTLKHINKCMLSGLSRPELNTSTQDICSREHSAGERHPISHSKGKKIHSVQSSSCKY